MYNIYIVEGLYSSSEGNQCLKRQAVIYCILILLVDKKKSSMTYILFVLRTCG